MSLRIGILLSGSGTTYEYLAQAIAEGRINGEICRVISSKAIGGGVERAKKWGHPLSICRPKDENHHQAIADILREDRVDLVVMAGWMHLWKLPSDFQNKTINVHPSLIPAFCGHGMYGHHVHEAVIEKGVKFSGCTVHLVDGEYDRGPILDQRVVNVESGDSPETLAARVQMVEKSLLVHIIRQWHTYRPTY